ncbi:neogenin-like [Amphiura filiformis]|uniref:neogenin-like n=1 Tax=Amphiura filiformis TaxID=82378 RepID=UPI003B216BA3
MVRWRARLSFVASLIMAVAIQVHSQPGPVSNLEVVRGISSSELKVTWTTPQTAVHNYIVEYIPLEEDGCYSTDFVRQGYGAYPHTVTEVTISGLQAFSKYNVFVTTSSSSHVRGEERSREGTTRAAVPTGSPQSVLSTAVGTTSLDFSWSEVLCGDRRGHINGYHYELRHDGSSDVIAADVTGRSGSISNLSAGIEYRFRVAAKTSAGVGVYSNDVTVSTILTTRLVLQNV